MAASMTDGPRGTAAPRKAASPSASATASLDGFERYLLGLVDGTRDVEALADATMSDPAMLRDKLRELVARGLVEWEAVPSPAPTPAAPTDAAPKAAAPGPELEPERRIRIDLIHASLEDATHYELLGIRPESDKALVKRAYFALSKEFHPDTQYGKQLGAYKTKMEVIFRRLTEAHDVLTRPKRKAEYDEELARTKKQPFALELHPEVPGSTPAEKPAAIAPEPAAPAASAPLSASVPKPKQPSRRPAPAQPVAPTPEAKPIIPSAPVSSPRTVRVSTPGKSDDVAPRPAPSSPGTPRPATPAIAAPPTSSTGVPRVSIPQPTPQPTPQPAPRPAPTAASAAIGQRLARDLSRQTGHGDIAAPAAPAAPGPAAPKASDDRGLLRALAGASQITGPVDRVEHYVKQALALESQGDAAGALSCLKLAVQFDPGRSDVRAWYDRIERQVAASDAENQRARAKSEEKAGRLETAAIAWGRVCLGRPDDFEGHLGVARCLLESRGDLRKARDFAQKAVELSPTSFQARILLVRVFQGAGMKLNAIRELEVAATLDPTSQLVKNLQRELK